MSMVRGKLEAVRDVSPENLVVGEVLFIERDGQWYDNSEPETAVELDIFSLDQLKQQHRPKAAKNSGR